MIKVGDIITIHGYDYDQMQFTDRKFKILDVMKDFILCEHVREKYKECFSYIDLVGNGYLPGIPDKRIRDRIYHTESVVRYEY